MWDCWLNYQLDTRGPAKPSYRSSFAVLLRALPSSVHPLQLVFLSYPMPSRPMAGLLRTEILSTLSTSKSTSCKGRAKTVLCNCVEKEMDREAWRLCSCKESDMTEQLNWTEKTLNTAGLRLLPWERPADRAGPWLASGNLYFRHGPITS